MRASSRSITSPGSKIDFSNGIVSLNATSEIPLRLRIPSSHALPLLGYEYATDDDEQCTHHHAGCDPFDIAQEQISKNGPEQWRHT